MSHLFHKVINLLHQNHHHHYQKIQLELTNLYRNSAIRARNTIYYIFSLTGALLNQCVIHPYAYT